MSHPAPDSEQISIVLVGSWNPGIFHPEWFRRHEILSAEDADKAVIKAITPEITEILFLNLKLDVMPDRFMILTTDASSAEKLQDIVLNVLAKLPHTPIMACGLNNGIEFDLKDESYWHKIGHTLAPKEEIWNGVLDRPGLLGMQIKGVREGDFPGAVNVTVQPSKDPATPFGLFVYSNFHYDVPRNEGGTARSELVPRFIEAAWKPALEQARSVAYRIFQTIPRDRK